ncbi:hypothetical protein BAE44_0000337, partial [Dichanthelium oligosanthes]
LKLLTTRAVPLTLLLVLTNNVCYDGPGADSSWAETSCWKSLNIKKIIEENLGISCLFDDAVKELMWGLKNCMRYLVLGEKSELTEDRLHMSEGMKIVLDRYKLEVEPEMVSSSPLSPCEHLKKISDIDSQHLGLVKLGTALMILCNFHDEPAPGDPLEVNHNTSPMYSWLLAVH